MSQQKKLDDYMRELKAAAAVIDKADTPLEEAINAYEDGARAFRNCIEIIERAEQKINIITQTLRDDNND